MKTIFKSLLLLLCLVPALASAQSKIPQRNEIVSIEQEINGVIEELEVFDSPRDGQHRYFLSVGHLGVGDDFIQMQVDPLFELFIPLGETLEEAQEGLLELKELIKSGKNDVMMLTGCLSLAVPNDQLEPVKVVCRKLFVSKVLEFSVSRGNYVRATYLDKGDINSLINGVKFYRKLHPKEP